jgi:hypothetical protein
MHHEQQFFSIHTRHKRDRSLKLWQHCLHCRHTFRSACQLKLNHWCGVEAGGGTHTDRASVAGLGAAHVYFNPMRASWVYISKQAIAAEAGLQRRAGEAGLLKLASLVVFTLLGHLPQKDLRDRRVPLVRVVAHTLGLLLILAYMA